jgi:mannonate dehydratase
MAIRLGSWGRRGDLAHDTFLRQHGVEDVLGSYIFHPSFRDTAVWGDQSGVLGFDELSSHWELLDLIQLRNRFDAAGLRLVGLEQAVPRHCLERIQFGLAGRDEQINQLIMTIRNMGRAGLNSLAYSWSINPPGVVNTSWRTSEAMPGRGGARVTSFNLAEISSDYLSRGVRVNRDELFKNYEYFLERVLPAAEEAGIRLAIHPDDPPVESLGGADRLFYDAESHRKALALSSSRFHGIVMCFGNWGVMPGDLLANIHEFGKDDRIVYCHLQGVVGHVPKYHESFLDESDLDWFQILGALRDVGFDGGVFPAHFPDTVFDSAPRQDNGVAYTCGYTRAVIQAVEAGGLKAGSK